MVLNIIVAYFMNFKPSNNFSKYIELEAWKDKYMFQQAHWKTLLFGNK